VRDEENPEEEEGGGGGDGNFSSNFHLFFLTFKA
jgi:hypothetical protein